MKRFSRRSWGRYAGLGLLSLALLGSPALLSPVDAMPASGPGVPCLQPSTDQGPALRRRPDTSPVSAAVLDRVERRLAATRRALAERSSGSTARTAALPTYRVKVQIHIIHGKHRGERQLKRAGARTKVFRILQAAYNGAQSSDSEPMGVVFDLKRITVTRNDRWYHATPMSRADRQMKRRLHRGTATTLNIYVNKPTFRGGGVLLGYSRFPWQYRAHKKLDGVTINVRSLPIAGSKSGFNLGDSVVHETGHWLGLLHTFYRGCDPYNDGVADTPAERNPYGNTGCVDPTNLCDPSDVLVKGYFDPAYNFMEYTRDACMRMFTAGQHERASNMFATFRAGR